MKRLWVWFLFLGVAGCGGNSRPSPTPTTPSAGTPPPSTTNTPLGSPTVVGVGAGQTAGGVDIAVNAGGGSPNAQLLGVAAVGAGGSASNTGAVIHRGATMKVLLFGPGLDGSLQVVIGGPSDISVSNVRSITSTQNTPGIAFDAAVSGGAALGARSVYLITSDGRMTVFSGGLEVVP